jgi:tetratricopeptide (TPR) repeat protein
MGRYSEAEQNLTKGLRITTEIGDQAKEIWFGWQLGYALGKQQKYENSSKHFDRSLELAQSLGVDYRGEILVIKGFQGEILCQQGLYDKAEEYLKYSLEGKEDIQDHIGLPELLERLGTLHAAQQNWDKALDYYQRCLERNKFGLRYFESKALIGKSWALYHLKSFEAIPPVAAEADLLMERQFEFYDQWASLRLLQGHLAWDGLLEGRENSFDVAKAKYQQALIYALRYNRFMLDEVLGGNGGAHLLFDPIISYCLKRREGGRKMLKGLRSWWQSADNEDDIFSSDITISPIAEGISLLDAESSAREHELVDNGPQKTVEEQLEKALA